MACSWLRVDTTDQTTTTQDGKYGCQLHVEERSEIFFWWSEDNNMSGFSNSEVHFRRLNTETLTFSSDITVQDTTGAPNGTPYMVRFDDGKLLMVWGSGSSYGTQLKSKASTDHGTTWGADASLTMAVANMNPCGLATDGTDAWLLAIKLAGGGSDRDIWAYKYTAATDTWSGATKVFACAGQGGAIGTLEFMGGGAFAFWQRRMVMVDDEIGMLIAARTEDNEVDATKKISILRTDDAWATATVIDIEHYLTADDGGEHNPVLDIDEDGRIIAAWTFVPTGSSTSRNCVVAYSDDQGLTWTITGVPTAISDEQAISGTQFRPSLEPALYLHPDGRTFLTTMGAVSTDPARTYRYRKFYGSETTTAGWQVNDCTLDWSSDGLQINSLYTYSVDVTPNGIFMAVGAATFGGTSVERIYVLIDTSFTTGGGGPGPPVPEPSPSGGDENNIIARKVLGPNSGGWSLHSFPVTCWLPWDEGDANAGREVPILTAGAEVFPALQDPALIPAINRIHAPDLYAVRVYLFSGGFTQQYDPLKMVVETKQFELDGPHNRNVVRAIYVAYQRAGRPFTAELWIDDHLVGSWQMEDTQGRMVEKFHAVPTYSNVGARAWMRFVDESVDGLLIDSVEFVYIKKGRRGNSA